MKFQKLKSFSGNDLNELCNAVTEFMDGGDCEEVIDMMYSTSSEEGTIVHNIVLVYLDNERLQTLLDFQSEQQRKQWEAQQKLMNEQLPEENTKPKLEVLE